MFCYYRNLGLIQHNKHYPVVHIANCCHPVVHVTNFSRPSYTRPPSRPFRPRSPPTIAPRSSHSIERSITYKSHTPTFRKGTVQLCLGLEHSKFNVLPSLLRSDHHARRVLSCFTLDGNICFFVQVSKSVLEQL